METSYSVAVNQSLIDPGMDKLRGSGDDFQGGIPPDPFADNVSWF